MFTNTSAREGEPDLYLNITYKNWATFDRGALRTIGSTYVVQDVKFKDK